MICTDLHRLAMSKSEMLWRQGHMRQIRPQFGLYEAIWYFSESEPPVWGEEDWKKGHWIIASPWFVGIR